MTGPQTTIVILILITLKYLIDLELFMYLFAAYLTTLSEWS